MLPPTSSSCLEELSSCLISGINPNSKMTGSTASVIINRSLLRSKAVYGIALTKLLRLS